MRNRNVLAIVAIVVAAVLAASPPVRGHESVFLVSGSSGTGDGFLVERSGLIVTSHTAVAGGRYIAVTVAPDRTVAADLLSYDEQLGVAVIRVHPDAVAGLEPLRLAKDPPGAEPIGPGDTIRLPSKADWTTP